MAIDISQIVSLLEKNQGKIYIACSGENDYPNISVRQVDVLEDRNFGYFDEDESRTVLLMKNRPNITLFIEEKPYHGLKIKGKALFQPNMNKPVTHKFTEEIKIKNPVAVIIRPEEIFPY